MLGVALLGPGLAHGPGLVTSAFFVVLTLASWPAQVGRRWHVLELARVVPTAIMVTLAALEATVRGPVPPVTVSLHATADELRTRVDVLATALGREVVAVDGRVGGGGAPGVPLPGWAVEVPVEAVERLREHPMVDEVEVSFPDARQRGLSGQVVMSIGIRRDGSVESSQVLVSSGKPVLDQAALRIAKLAQPYPPLPKTADNIDVLNVVRTWNFRPGGTFDDE